MTETHPPTMPVARPKEKGRLTVNDRARRAINKLLRAVVTVAVVSFSYGFGTGLARLAVGAWWRRRK